MRQQFSRPVHALITSDSATCDLRMALFSIVEMNTVCYLLSFFMVATSAMNDAGTYPKVFAPYWSERSDGSFPRYSLFIHCILPDNAKCKPNSTMELYIGDTLWEKKECESMSFRIFHFWIATSNDSTFFSTEISCKYYDGITSYTSREKYVVPFLHCTRESTDCAKAECPSDDGKKRFCLWTADGTQPCRGSFDRNWCAIDTEPRHRYCPVDRLGFCSAMSTDPEAIWYTMFHFGDEKCLPNVTTSPISYKGNSLKTGDFIVVDLNNTALTVDCPVGSPFHEMAVVLSEISGGVTRHEYGTCHDRMTLPFHRTDNDKAIKTVSLVIHMQQDEISRSAEFRVEVISFGHATVNVTGEDGDIRPYFDLFCKLRGVESFIPEPFRKTQWWTRKSQGETPIAPENPPRWSNYLNVTENDEYQCHMEITYKSCSPYFKVTRLFSSEPFKVDSVVITTTSGVEGLTDNHAMCALGLVSWMFMRAV